MGILSDLITAGTTIAGVSSQIKANDLNYQLQRENLDYQKAIQQTIFDREDNAVQRRVADLKKAGLSPTLAAGSSAGVGSIVSTRAPEKTSNLEAFAALASLKTLLAQQQKAQTEADRAKNELIQEKLNTDYYIMRGVAPVEVSQAWQQRLVNLIYPKLESWVFGDKDKGNQGLLDKVIGSFSNINSVDTSNYKTFDKDIPRVKLANGDTLNDYEYSILKKEGLLDTFYTTGWTKFLESVVYGN